MPGVTLHRIGPRVVAAQEDRLCAKHVCAKDGNGDGGDVHLSLRFDHRTFREIAPGFANANRQAELLRIVCRLGNPPLVHLHMSFVLTARNPITNGIRSGDWCHSLLLVNARKRLGMGGNDLQDANLVVLEEHKASEQAEDGGDDGRDAVTKPA